MKHQATPLAHGWIGSGVIRPFFKKSRQVFHGLVLFLGLMLAAAGAQPVVVAVETKNPGAEISPEALGLSYETSLMLPDAHGVRYFRPDNRPLVRLFRTLGIRSLRLGGNSVDAARFPVPSQADIRSLFQFADAAGVKVIYTVRLENGDPHSAADIAQFIRRHHAAVLDCFAIGNEPKGYYKDTNIYLAKWTAIRDAMRGVWPEARFCGPDDNPSPEWCRMLVRNSGAPAGPLIQITQHSYSFGCSYKNPGEKEVTKLVPVEAAAAREKMLSPKAYDIYQKIYDGIATSIGDAPISFRMSEVNSYWFSGLEGASDRYASALWAVDYLHWWTLHGAAGLNFHTGDRTGGAITLPCRYAAFVSSSKGYEVRPLGYGLKLFSLGGQGRMLPATVSGATNGNVAAYASLSGKKTVYVTVINKAHGGAAADTEVEIKWDEVLKGENAQVIELLARDNDIAAGSSEVTLGGAPILEDGSWGGKWAFLPLVPGAERLRFHLPSAAAAVVRVRIQ